MSADSPPLNGDALAQSRRFWWAEGRHRWLAADYLTAGVWLAAGALALAVIALQLHNLFGREWGVDFAVFHRAATRALHGDWAIYNTTRPVQGWDFLYPPQSLILFAPFAAFNVETAFWIFAAVGLVLLGASLALVGRLEDAGRPPLTGIPALACNLMLAANFAVWMTIFSGQVSFFVLFACVGFLWALYRGRHLLAGALIAGGVLLKIYPLVMLAAPVMKQQLWSVLGWTLASALLITVAALLFVPSDLFGTYFFTQLPKLSGKASVFFTNQSIVSFMARLGTPRKEWYEFSHTVLILPVRLSLAVAILAIGGGLGYIAVRGRGQTAVVAAFALCALPGVVTAGSFMYVFVASLPLFHVVLRDVWSLRRRYPLLAALLPIVMMALFIPAWTRLPGGDSVPAVLENLFYTRSSFITAAFVVCGLFLASRAERHAQTVNRAALD